MIPRRRGFRYRPRTDTRGNYIVRAEILSNERNGDTHHGAEWDYVTQPDPDALPTLVRLQRGRDGGEGR